jgi:hypothetical protein
MRARTSWIALAAVSLLAGSRVFAAAPDKRAVPAVQPGKSQIVFMRHTSVNALVSTPLYEVTSGTPKVVGKVSNNCKVVLDLAPGDYVFMIGNGPWLEFMRASVLADKRYYVVVTAYWPARFSLRTVRHQEGEFRYSSREFKEIMNATTLAKAMSAKDKKGDKNAALFYPPQWEKWQAKTADEKAILTLRPEDSIS